MTDDQMIIIEPSEKDFVLGRTLDTGWFQFEITDIITKPKKDDDKKTNIVVTCSCITASDSQGPCAGIEVTRYFSMDEPKWLIKFIKDGELGEVAAGTRLNVKALIGKRFDGQNVPREYQGNMQNDLKNIAPLGKFTNV